MLPARDENRQRTLSWSIFIIACVSYLCLSWSEQGTRGEALLEPPVSPLPFNRQQVLGLDLRQHSSLAAYQWLAGTQIPSAGIIVIPIDADVVVALGEGDIQDAALSATDSLVAAGAGSPLATCLRQPDGVADPVATAEVAVQALIDRYPDVIAYVFACNFAAEPEWHSAVITAMEHVNPRVSGVDATLLPVSGGAPVTLIDIDDPADVRVLAEGGGGTGGYVIISLEIDAPISTQDLEDAQLAILESPHVGLVLLRPSASVDPLAVRAALEIAPVSTDLLLTGFSNASLHAITRQGDWHVTSVGTIEYLRTASDTASLEATFVGTDLYVHGVRSPNAGRIRVWIDPPPSHLPDIPTKIIELEAEQARDSAIHIETGLSASRHRLVIVAENQDGSNVMISGIFVSGSPTRAWAGGLAAAGLLLVAVTALADRCMASISSIRRTTGPPSTGGTEHPRGFVRRG
jgi:hypothetical protein